MNTTKRGCAPGLRETALLRKEWNELGIYMGIDYEVTDGEDDVALAIRATTKKIEESLKKLYVMPQSPSNNLKGLGNFISRKARTYIRRSNAPSRPLQEN